MLFRDIQYFYCTFILLSTIISEHSPLSILTSYKNAYYGNIINELYIESVTYISVKVATW